MNCGQEEVYVYVNPNDSSLLAMPAKPVIQQVSTTIHNGDTDIVEHIGFNVAGAEGRDCQLDYGPRQACSGPVNDIVICCLGSSGHSFTLRAWNYAGETTYTATWYSGQPAPVLTKTYTNIWNGSPSPWFHEEFSIANAPLTIWSAYPRRRSLRWLWKSHELQVGRRHRSARVQRSLLPNCVTNYGGTACAGLIS